MWGNWHLAFIPIFVAMDPVGLIPIYMGAAAELGTKARRGIFLRNVLAAGILGTVFIFVGTAIFRAVSIELRDFQIAGGLILLVFSVHDLLFAGGAERRKTEDQSGLVPLATPLTVGPAVVTSCLVLVNDQTVGMAVTFTAFAANLLLLATALLFADSIIRRVPGSVMRMVSKVISLLLAAIAVKMICQGILAYAQASG
jgi:multiple antibiotic resistance protein